MDTEKLHAQMRRLWTIIAILSLLLGLAVGTITGSYLIMHDQGMLGPYHSDEDGNC